MLKLEVEKASAEDTSQTVGKINSDFEKEQRGNEDAPQIISRF